MRGARSALLSVLLSGTGLLPVAARAETGYGELASLDDAVRALAGAFPDACQVLSLGRSRNGRELWALELARGEGREQRTALALVAGLDGDHPAGCAVALRVARGLLEAGPDQPAAQVLAQHRVYVIPCVNPDALVAFFATPKHEQRAGLRPVDDDRDEATDEDGPDDLNGDNLITMMRVPLGSRRIDGLEPTLVMDPAEPSLLREARRAQGETPVYALLAEGRDDDSDGVYNEDGPGGVDLGRNFTHLYQEHAPGTGPHPLSEPESKALIDFFLSHPHIAATLVYGRHDNLARAPKSTTQDAGKDAPKDASNQESGRGSGPGARPPRPSLPQGLHEEDVALYAAMHERYVELTGVKEAPDEPADGALYAWAYAEYGIPAFACRVWTRPLLAAEHKIEKAGGDGSTAGGAPGLNGQPQAGSAQQATPTTTDAPQSTPPDGRPALEQVEAEEHHAEGAGVDPPRPADDVAAGAAAATPSDQGTEKKDKAADEDAASWLKYSDEQRGGSGYVDWTPFDHPQLGSVELGGFVPFFRTTPPAEELDDIARKHLAFAADLGDRLPRLMLLEDHTRRLSDQLFEIEIVVRNEGYFPTALGMAQVNRRVRPIVLALDLPPERLVGGPRLERVWSIPGSGGEHRTRWIVRGSAGDAIRVRMTSEKFGTQSLSVDLRE